MIDKYEPLPDQQTSSYLPIMRASNEMFEQRLEELLPAVRSGKDQSPQTPIAFTEEVAYDWLAKGGKRFRPFITLAAYDALTGATAANHARDESGDRTKAYQFDRDICRIAMAIEAFHKASLVHDDIQDSDMYRYGRARHCTVSTARAKRLTSAII